MQLPKSHQNTRAFAGDGCEEKKRIKGVLGSTQCVSPGHVKIISCKVTKIRLLFSLYNYLSFKSDNDSTFSHEDLSNTFSLESELSIGSLDL